jgi:hypothetical protein
MPSLVDAKCVRSKCAKPRRVGFLRIQIEDQLCRLGSTSPDRDEDIVRWIVGMGRPEQGFILDRGRRVSSSMYQTGPPAIRDLRAVPPTQPLSGVGSGHERAALQLGAPTRIPSHPSTCCIASTRSEGFPGHSNHPSKPGGCDQPQVADAAQRRPRSRTSYKRSCHVTSPKRGGQPS